MSHFKKDDFAAELQRLMTEFLDTITLNTTDETEINFKNFVSVFKACIDKHALLKPASRKKRRLLTKLQMKFWIKSSKNKNFTSRIMSKVQKNKNVSTNDSLIN